MVLITLADAPLAFDLTTTLVALIHISTSVISLITVIMPTRVAVKTDKAPPPLPVYSQAIVCSGMVYCSGQVAMHPETKAMVEGGISDRTVNSEMDNQRSFVETRD